MGFGIIKYNDSMLSGVMDFFSKVFPESGKAFEPQGRHTVFADIEHNFMGFWCLMDGDEVIGTVAVKRLNDSQCELKGLYLYKRYHGQKLGYRLIQTAISFAQYSADAPGYRIRLPKSNAALYKNGLYANRAI